MLNRNTDRDDIWRPLVYKTQAKDNVGIPEPREGIEKHRSFLSKADHLDYLLEERVRQRFLCELQCLILKEVRERLEKSANLDEIIHSLKDRLEDPHSHAERVLEEIFRS